MKQLNHKQTAVLANGRFHSLITWLKRDYLILLLYILLTIGLTWPIAGQLGDNWLATRDVDTSVKLWDQWWLQRRLDTSQPLLYTYDLFHPIGLDLSYHSISWTVAPISWLLTPLLGQIDAYNVTILWAVFSTAYAAYLLIHYLLKNRTAALVGGFICSFAPHHISHVGGHPDLVHLAPVSLAALLLLISFRNGRSRLAIVGTAVMIGIATFTSLYVMIFALLTLGPLFVFLAFEQHRWRTRRFWRISLWIGVLTTILLLIRLWPILANPTTLGQMIEAKYAANVGQTDLRSLITPSHFNPIFAPYVGPISARFAINNKWPAYLGFVPLLLILAAFTWRQKLAEATMWLVTGLMFLIFSLGPALRLNGILYEEIILPANSLAWFPPIRAVGRPDYFVLGLLLPLAILAAYGFQRIWQKLAGSSHQGVWQTAFLLIVFPLLIFEFWNGPFPGTPVDIHPFYLELAQQPETFSLIELPMGRRPSKQYLMHQIFHQKPIVEGLSARTPPEAYRYIESNSLLLHWQHRTWLNCDTMGVELDTAVTQLIQDNFRYVILHNQPEIEPILPYFLYIEPIVQDEILTVYALADLQKRPFCP